MKMHATFSIALISSILVGSSALAEEAKGQEKAPSKPSPKPNPALWLPAGMAPADNPKAVASLYSEAHQKRVEAAQQRAAAIQQRAAAIQNPALTIQGHTPQEKRLTAAEEYHLRLIAYRTQLVEEQRERKIKEMELQLEREARLRAEERVAQAERERRRESIYVLHQHSLHAYQRRLNDDYWREQRLRQIIRDEHSQPCSPAPCPSPAPSSSSVSSSPEEESTGDVLP